MQALDLDLVTYFHADHRQSSQIEQRGVVPDIFIIVTDNEPPTWRKSQKPHRLWTILSEVLHMKRHEEIRTIRPLYACPDIPSSCISFRWMPKAIQWQDTCPDISCHPYLHVVWRFHTHHTEALAGF